MATAVAKKVYDFKMEPVKSKLVTTFKRRQNESTIADLIATTGLAKYQVEQAAKVVLDEYGGHLKVTESGELLYHFPRGMHSRISGFVPRFKRFVRGFFSLAGKILTFLFKIWIMVMLVGYFIVFLAIALLAVVAAIAASTASRSDSRSRSRGGGFGAFFLVIKLLEFFLRIFFWVSLTKASRQRKAGRPLYKSIFAFVFGDVDPNANWDSEEKVRVISFIRSQKGVITTEELMALTGRDYSGAQELMNSYLVEFEGEPMVTDDGSIFYFFPELLRTRKEELLVQETVTVGDAAYKKTIPFANNKGKTNAAIIFFNSFNLIFGSYFTIFSLIGYSRASDMGLGFVYTFLSDLLKEFVLIPDPALGIMLILGFVPLSFSVLFFLVPLVRKIRLHGINEKIKRENLQKKLFGALYYNPLGFDPDLVSPAGESDSPANPKAVVSKALDRFAGEKHAEFKVDDAGKTLYNFEELDREIHDIAQHRKTIDLKKYEVGKTVFDSNE